MKTIDEQKHEERRNASNWPFDLLSLFAVEVVMWPMLAVFTFLSFLLFDRFHITNATTQVLIAVSPLLLLAFYLWRFAKVPLFRVPPSPKTDDDDEISSAIAQSELREARGKKD